MQYGYLDDARREYVITTPLTPLPWINYLGADEFCGLISNTAGGYCFYKDPLLQRITRYRYFNVPLDAGGRYLYIRDNDTQDYWSASWQPVQKPLDAYQYECRHGLGYTRITSEYAQIKSSTLYLVPKNENNEVWVCTLTNRSDRVRKLSVFSLVEFCGFQGLGDMTNFQANLNTNQANVEDDVIYNVSLYNHVHDPSVRFLNNVFSFFFCNRAIAGYETQSRDFFGTYGSFEKPRAVIEDACHNSIALGWMPVGSHKVSLSLQPGESQQMVFVLGAARLLGEEKPIIAKYRNASDDLIQRELQTLKEYWDHNLSAYQATTPDAAMNTMVNIWNQYQCRTTFNWSRSASYYESGIGRGMGFRDSCQDILGFVHMIPAEARARILEIAGTQFAGGDAAHQYQPLTKKGDGGGASDDHLWLIIATAQYIKETGDFGVLDEVVPFAKSAAGEKAPLYNHLDRALEFTMAHRGPHGLPLMLDCDWNDCLNLFGDHKVAESVWTGMQFVFSAREMARLAVLRKDPTDEARYQRLAEAMTENINLHAWDGQWYRRAYTEQGRTVGGRECAEGRIFLLPQAWAVMAGIAPPDRALLAMNAVGEQLATEHGIMLVTPPYTKMDMALGGITVFIPGLKENGSIFRHPNPWAIMAEAMLGRGDIAYKYYRSLLPAGKHEMADVRKVEPYVYCQMIAGKAHPDFGEGKNSWLTGTAAYSFFAVSSYLLGLRADYHGLIVDPVIPSSWDHLTLTRRFRGAVYHVDIRNPDHVNRGIRTLKVDGAEIEGNLLPCDGTKEEYTVEAVMG